MDEYVKTRPACISLGFMPKIFGYYEPSNIFYNAWKVRMASNLSTFCQISSQRHKML